MKGFGLIGLLIAVAVIGLLAGGGLYFRETQNRKSQVQIGLEFEKRAKDLRDQIMRQQKNQLEGIGENIDRPEAVASALEFRITGFYLRDTTDYYYSVVECDTFVVTGGDQMFVKRFKDLVTQGNSINRLDNVGRLVLTVNLDGLNSFDKEVILSSNNSNKIELLVSEKPTDGGGAPACYSFVKITKVVTDSSNKIDISTWKTYRNEKYGFEVRYPDISAYFKTSFNGWTNWSEPRITSRTSFDYHGCVATDKPLPGIPQKSKLTLAGREYCLIVISRGGAAGIGGTDYEYVSRIGNEDVGIVFEAIYPLAKGVQADQAARYLFNQILSTFKFIK